MPRDIDCLEKHRLQTNVSCSNCSFGLAYSFQSLKELEHIIQQILEDLCNIQDWNKLDEKLALKLSLVIEEAAMNALEHGLLSMSKNEKKLRLKQLNNKYHQHLMGEWKKRKNIPLHITACINGMRILLGFHDDGSGYDFPILSLNGDNSIEDYAPNGRGLSILREYSDMYLNEQGNTLLCSIPLNQN